MQNDSTAYSKTVAISILQAIEEVNRLKDVDTILDRILSESRRLTQAGAGSIYLVEGSGLIFGNVQNDFLRQEDNLRSTLYQNIAIPINKESIVGYVAKTKQPLAIDDAYALEVSLPYSFNKSFDEKSGYRTTSMLTLPLFSQEGRLVGVMQLINAKDERQKTVPFNKEDQNYVRIFCKVASVAIERGMMNRELILRMMQMAELRDPSETGPHVQRVGAYSAEIYQAWARRHDIDPKQAKQQRDNIRLAAMLHDVGKVGIPDTILKKPGRLTDQEFDIIKWHTIKGARLFRNQTSELDLMSMEIALNHHEKWDGKGYPGKIPDIWSKHVALGPCKKGLEIPLTARITALADVFDALISRRCYKDAFSDEKAFAILEQDSGTHFDPEMVEIFFDISCVIKAIRTKYKDISQEAVLGQPPGIDRTS